jgi:glycosyltransferase involved in cell wall biosynthesis
MPDKIYLLTPTLNAERYLEETITSVAQQRCDSLIVYHIQDGGSVDSTLGIIEKWAKKICGQKNIVFSYASAPDSGLYDAINKGFAAMDIPDDACMGWINADDLLGDGALQTVLAVFSMPGVEWVCGMPSRIDAQGRFLRHGQKFVYPGAFLASGLADGVTWPFVQQEGCFFRKSIWDKVGGCDTRFRLAGDWDLWRRMAAFASPVHIPKALGHFRSHPAQLSHNPERYMEEINAVVSLEARKKRMFALLFVPEVSLKTLHVQAEGIIFKPFPFRFWMRALCIVCGLWKHLRPLWYKIARS